MRKMWMNISMVLMAGALAAQTSPVAPATPKKAAPATAVAVKPIMATATPAKPAVTKPTTKAVPPKPAVAAKAPVAKTPVKAKAPAAVASTMSVKPAAKPAAAKKIAANDEHSVVKGGRRDPFLNPIKLQQDKASSSVLCTNGGPQCLVVDQVTLLGVVKTQKGMIAMVENATKKQYNLHESDNVMNGKVVRITRDSVVFRETVTDNLGKSSTREVVKRVTVPVV